MTTIKICPAENYTQKLLDFKSEFGIDKIIGFSGGADSKLHGIPDDDELQRRFTEFSTAFHERIIFDALGLLRQYRIAVLTGGTHGGIPELATKKAKELSFRTIGVYPLRGAKRALGPELLDFSICVEPVVGQSRWSDEGSVWTALVDAVIVIAGNAGTLTECAHIQKINESLVADDNKPKYIVPIYGTGGVADQLPYLWAKPEIRNKSMPLERIYTGGQAAGFLIDNLDLSNFDYNK